MEPTGRGDASGPSCITGRGGPHLRARGELDQRVTRALHHTRIHHRHRRLRDPLRTPEMLVAHLARPHCTRPRPTHGGASPDGGTRTRTGDTTIFRHPCIVAPCGVCAMGCASSASVRPSLALGLIATIPVVGAVGIGRVRHPGGVSRAKTVGPACPTQRAARVAARAERARMTGSSTGWRLAEGISSRSGAGRSAGQHDAMPSGSVLRPRIGGERLSVRWR